MKSLRNFSLALHALGHMAQQPARAMTSEELALQNHTNAVVVRRILGNLRRKGLVHSEKGHAGGWRLARDAGKITAADVYKALNEEYFQGSKIMASRPHCTIEKELRAAILDSVTEAEKSFVALLAKTTIEGLASSMLAGVNHS